MTHVSATHKITNGDKFVKPLLIDRTTVKSVADESLVALRNILRPVNRTGDLDSSWNIIANTSGFQLWSTDWAAHSLQTGFNQPPPKDVLLAWMATKPEFSSLDIKEKEQVAFAIRLSIARGDSPGPKSTIGNLQPSGERRFDYFSVFTKEVKAIIKRRFA